MRVLLIYNGAYVFGGIETLLCRMSHWFVRNGWEVDVLVQRSDLLTTTIAPEARVFEVGATLGELFDPRVLKKVLEQYEIRDLDLIFAYCQSSAIVAAFAANIPGQRKAVCMAGNFVPKYFAQFSGRAFHPYSILFRYSLKWGYGTSTRLAMCSNYIQQLTAFLGQGSSATFWPLPVSADPYIHRSRKPTPGKIVSVGRLEPMKEYNLYMPSIIERLVARGHDVTWHVFGDGEYESEMRLEIEKRKLSERIILHGSISYSRLPEVFDDAWAFVGMGTSVIEAAMSGVPNLMAFPYDEEGLTHGSLQQLDFEDLDKPNPQLRVIDELDRILRLDVDGYAAESAVTKEYAMRFSEDAVMKIFQCLPAPVAMTRFQRQALFQLGIVYSWLRRHPIRWIKNITAASQG